jgi:nucleoside-diphosphate-sugar epimerase
MNVTSRIYLAGHRSLVGLALTRRLQAEGFSNLITRTHAELDLEHPQEVEAFFAEARPMKLRADPGFPERSLDMRKEVEYVVRLGRTDRYRSRHIREL